MGIKKISYEHSEKFRAEVFKFAGYASCTPLSILLVTLITKPSALEVSIWLPSQNDVKIRHEVVS